MHYLVFLSLTLNEGHEQFLRYAIFDHIFQLSLSDTITDVFGDALSNRRKVA